MTALLKYQRLECTGLWRPPEDKVAPDAAADPTPDGRSDPSPESGPPPPTRDAPQPPQRREVFVSFGAATLVLSGRNNVALTHWSLPAISRLNPGQRPAIFSPDKEASETLEIDDPDMIDAIEKVRAAIARQQPRAGRLRLALGAGLAAIVLALAVLWLPGTLIRQTVRVVPEAKRAEIGQALLDNIGRVTGLACVSPYGTRALAALNQRLAPGRRERLTVLPSGVATTEMLPSGILLLNRALVEDYDDPEVVAGYILAEQLRSDRRDPLERLLRTLGVVQTIRLLTTGELPRDALARYSEHLLGSTPDPVPNEALLARFKSARLASTPYAYAIDISGETTLPLIEADPFRGTRGDLVLSDDDWVSLQGICGE